MIQNENEQNEQNESAENESSKNLSDKNLSKSNDQQNVHSKNPFNESTLFQQNIQNIVFSMFNLLRKNIIFKNNKHDTLNSKNDNDE